ncbi:MAG: ABC transporter permease [Pseudomonadota bacterium]|uniref:ABC transporter permease n=1 Tax=Tabrizicola sp. TaxID=2005166 RepID=UPI0025FE16C4|nr:ABC transporter permease [Tabrizicola sp.]
MQDLLRRYGTGLTSVFCLLVAFWILVLIVLPNFAMFEQSFRPYLPVVEVGGPKDVYSFANYSKILDNGFESTIFGIPVTLPIHVLTFLDTVFFSALVTFFTLVFAYPLAYYLAKIASPRSIPTLLLLLFIPMWVSEALRAFAWYVILTFNGPLNAALKGLGIIEESIRWQNGIFTSYDAIVIVLTYCYVLFMLFPIYTAITSLDTNQIEAAEDLGSPWWRTHWRVVIPHAKPGIASGCVMVFMLSAGSLLVPTVVGSTKANWFPQTIYTWFNDALDWNTGAAYSMIFLLACIVFVILMMRLFRVKLSDIAK